MCLALIRAPTAAESDAGRVSHAKHAQVTPFYQLRTTHEPVCLLRATHKPHIHLQAPPLPPRRPRFASRLPPPRLRATSPGTSPQCDLPKMPLILEWLLSRSTCHRRLTTEHDRENIFHHVRLSSHTVEKSSRSWLMTGDRFGSLIDQGSRPRKTGSASRVATTRTRTRTKTKTGNP
jgi:hypothetical protein